MENAPEIREIVVSWFEAVENGDTSFVDRYFSREASARLIGTDPNEWLVGADVADFLRREIGAMGNAGVKVSLDEPDAFREGDVGWALARPVITMPDDTTVPVRWTGVLRQEDGTWKFVFVHASIGVPNESLGELSKLWRGLQSHA